MAKAKDDRVAVVAGTIVFYEGVYHDPGAVIYMRPDDADDALAMAHVRAPRDGELKRAR